MTPPMDRFRSLPPHQRRLVLELLAEQAVAKWESYARSQGEIRYVETVCGTQQVVDAGLPRDALFAVRSGDGIADIAQRYQEPKAALQDGDLSFRESAELAYYGVYNFFRKYALNEDIDDGLILNQTISSEEEDGKWTPMLEKAIARAVRENA